MAIYYADEVTFEGCVLCKRERNWSDDSDFYAVVWNEEEQKIEEVMYDTTRFAGGGDARIDATPEVLEKAAVYNERVIYDILRNDALRKATTVDVGKVVVVEKGYKVPIGTKGEVFWTGFDSWGNKKIGIALSDRKDERGFRLDVAWTRAANVSVVDPESYVDYDEIAALAKKYRASFAAASLIASNRMGMIVI